MRDDFGILIDPKVHAKRSCRVCGGEGIRILTLAKDPENRHVLLCQCAQHGYSKVRQKVARALAQRAR